MSDPELEPAQQPEKLLWYQFSLRAVFAVTTLVAILLAAARTFGFGLGVFMVEWVIVLVILMVAGARACSTPRGRWGFACCVSLATVYGPFVIVVVNTWLLDGNNTWMRVEFWKYLWATPGEMVIEVTSMLLRHRHSGLSPAFELVFAGLSSAMMVAVTACLAAKARRARWVLVPIIAILVVYSALFLDAGMRM
jgi:hypothetical protein